MTRYDRVSVTVGVILIGCVLSLVLDMPSRTFVFNPLGTPLTLHIDSSWVLSLVLVGLSCAGTEAIMRTHPAVRQHIVRYTFPTWVLPGLTTLALAQALPRSPNLLYWLAGLGLGGGMLAWLTLASYGMLHPGAAATAGRPTRLALAGYALALVFFGLIYRTRLRSIVTATAVSLVAFSVSLALLYLEKKPIRRILLYSGVIAVVTGEMTWALNYWRASTLTVGVLLLLVFYVLTGITREHLRSSLRWTVIVEFLIVVAVGIWIVVRFGPTLS